MSSIAQGYTREEIRESVHQYYVQAQRTRKAWLDSKHLWMGKLRSNGPFRADIGGCGPRVTAECTWRHLESQEPGGTISLRNPPGVGTRLGDEGPVLLANVSPKLRHLEKNRPYVQKLTLLLETSASPFEIVWHTRTGGPEEI